jgi:hypothetical protein
MALAFFPSSSCFARGWTVAAALLGILTAAFAVTGAAHAQAGSSSVPGAFQQIDVQDAWAKTNGDCSNVLIAVIGNGFDIDHPGLKDNILANPGEVLNGVDDDGNGYIDDIYGWNFKDNNNDVRPDPNDVSGVPWHDTYVTGIIGASGLDGQEVSGICKKARIVPIKKVLVDGNQYGAEDQAAAAINYAVDYQHRESAREGHYVPMVINGSWGIAIGWGNAPMTLAQAMMSAANAGIPMVFAAGNYSSSDDAYGSVVLPASWSVFNDYVIAVGAVDASDHLSSVSNYGNAVTITAPAVNIVSTTPGGGYAFDIAGENGFTSFATPQVTAAIAMYWSQHPDAPFSTVRTALLGSADHIGSLPVLNGNRLNIGRMLTEY